MDAARLQSLVDDRRKLVEELQESTAGGKLTADDLIASGEKIGETLVVVAETPGANPNVMRGWIDQPTTCRLNKSSITVRYSQPSSVARYVMSVVQT